MDTRERIVTPTYTSTRRRERPWSANKRPRLLFGREIRLVPLRPPPPTPSKRPSYPLVVRRRADRSRDRRRGRV